MRDGLHTSIDISAICIGLGRDKIAKHSRTPKIVADAAHAILPQSAKDCTGNFFIDDEALRAEGVTDWSSYAATPGEPLFLDFFLDSEQEESMDGYLPFKI